jgi:hypothetical protein
MRSELGSYAKRGNNMVKTCYGKYYNNSRATQWYKLNTIQLLYTPGAYVI